MEPRTMVRPVSNWRFFKLSFLSARSSNVSLLTCPVSLRIARVFQRSSTVSTGFTMEMTLPAAGSGRTVVARCVEGSAHTEKNMLNHVNTALAAINVHLAAFSAPFLAPFRPSVLLH